MPILNVNVNTFQEEEDKIDSSLFLDEIISEKIAERENPPPVATTIAGWETDSRTQEDAETFVNALNREAGFFDSGAWFGGNKAGDITEIMRDEEWRLETILDRSWTSDKFSPREKEAYDRLRSTFEKTEDKLSWDATKDITTDLVSSPVFVIVITVCALIMLRKKGGITNLLKTSVAKKTQSRRGLFARDILGAPEKNADIFAWYYRLAVKEENAEAQNKLGYLYSSGIAVPENNAEAFKWFREAAKKGNVEAQNNLGAMYSLGLGIPENSVKAYVWLSMARAQGHSSAEKSLTNLKKKMTGGQIAEAQELATQCWESNYQDCD